VGDVVGLVDGLDGFAEGGEGGDFDSGKESAASVSAIKQVSHIGLRSKFQIEGDQGQI